MKLSIKTTWHLKNHWNISFRLKFQDKLFNGMFVLGWLFESKQSAIASSTFTDANDNKATCSSSAKSTHSPSKFISVDSHVDSTLGGIPFRGANGIECFIIYCRAVCLCACGCANESEPFTRHGCENENEFLTISHPNYQQFGILRKSSWIIDVISSDFAFCPIVVGAMRCVRVNGEINSLVRVNPLGKNKIDAIPRTFCHHSFDRWVKQQ